MSGSGQQWELIDTLPANQTSLNVSLLPNKEYRFRIASSSEVGRGESVEAPQAVSSSVVGECMGSEGRHLWRFTTAGTLIDSLLL